MIDRLQDTLADQRLVAHLAADEPSQNARLVTSLYLADELGRYCRALTPGDFTANPFAAESSVPACALEDAAQLLDRSGHSYRLQLTQQRLRGFQSCAGIVTHRATRVALGSSSAFAR